MILTTPQPITLSLSPREAADDNVILQKLKGIPLYKDKEIKGFHITKRSIDARRKPVRINLSLIVETEDCHIPNPSKKQYFTVVADAPEVVIVGAGPAGLFAGLRAIEHGLRPIIIERGKDVDSRRLDIAKISKEGKINSESNFCFGEGGAGAFSDGKLFTRSKKRGNIREVLEILYQFGASKDILIDSHPHIGTDKLPSIIKNIREEIKRCGGKVLFQTKMENLLLENDNAIGIITSEGEKILGPVFLATGHSARDTVRNLHKSGVEMEAKGLAIGVRLEHPQSLIDKMQYHSEEGRGKYLPAAEYNFVNQSDGRGVYTFCMCPGGVIVPAVSQDNQIVVNGMSASARAGKWANSGYVVELHPGDIKGFEEEKELEMMALQEHLEKVFSEESHGSLNAPAQRINDFLEDRLSNHLPSTSYVPGIHSSKFNKLFPAEISARLKDGLSQIGKKCKPFISSEGVMIGLESRTSSPVRIPRDSESMHHIKIKNFYPVGEGAGYAGGIVSSALDGMNSIDAYIKNGKNT